MTKYQVYMFAIKNFLYVVLYKSSSLFLNPFVPIVFGDLYIYLLRKFTENLINDLHKFTHQ